ncbi:MAG: SPOR domain-containing protein [Gammaproteobacteria bacterium]|nr:SPOR domain-containing protein [Gammaproteobacteria bacterium]
MAKPASRNTRRSGGNSIFTGVLIGLTVGAVLAVGVALWVTGNNPFSSATPAAVPSQPAPATPEAAPSFDFYKVLPSDTPSVLPPSAAPTAAAPRYYLQAGAFHNADDADNLKAQLAMLGVEAVIQTGEIADKGVFHRVRVGPFSAMDEVNRTRSLLTQNDIPATLVKEVPNPQETP